MEIIICPILLSVEFLLSATPPLVQNLDIGTDQVLLTVIQDCRFHHKTSHLVFFLSTQISCCCSSFFLVTSLLYVLLWVVNLYFYAAQRYFWSTCHNSLKLNQIRSSGVSKYVENVMPWPFLMLFEEGRIRGRLAKLFAFACGTKATKWMRSLFMWSRYMYTSQVC